MEPLCQLLVDPWSTNKLYIDISISLRFSDHSLLPLGSLLMLFQPYLIKWLSAPVHLRSPRLVAADPPLNDVPRDSSSLRHYQAIGGFALPLTRISINTSLSKFDFRPSEAEVAMLPKNVFYTNGQVPDRQYRRGTLQDRVRCIQTKQTATKCSIVDWVLKDTVWPEGAALTIDKNH